MTDTLDPRGEWGYAIHEVLKSNVCLAVQVMFCVLGFYLGELRVAMYPLVLVMALNLVANRDLTPSFSTLMLVSIAFTAGWRDAELSYYLISYLPVAILLGVSGLIHFYRFPPKWQKGRMYFSLLFVAIALAVGGLGVATVAEIFNFQNLFYVLGLGFGLLLVYFLVLNYTVSDKYHDLQTTIARIMVWTGIACTAIVFVHLIPHLGALGDFGWRHSFHVWRNSIATYLLLAIPFPFYFAAKEKRFYVAILWFLLGGLFALANVLTLSRGGVIFSLIILPFCIVYVIWKAENKINRWVFVVLSVVTIVVASVFLVPAMVDFVTISGDESRANMFRHAWELFLAHPFLGRGMGYMGPPEMYRPEAGTMWWFHSTLFQVIASMGIVGILAYGYQYANRIWTILRKKASAFSICVLLSYFAFSMYSMVDVGDFVPVPFAVIVVVLLASVEISTRDEPDSLPKLRNYVIGKFKKGKNLEENTEVQGV